MKAQAGILEQDPPDEVRAKIGRAVAAVVEDGKDRAWVESHLHALVGLGEESELGGDRRGEAFSAWRHFFEALAVERPVVLVFEDLHWADESLLDFVDELVDWVTDVPLLVVGTARPELLERRPGWGGGKLNAITLALSALDEEQTAKLIAQLLGRPLLAADTQQSLLERSGGNPLYAEQFADLFLERGSTDELPLPETLQGIIAARLDGLPPPEKELLQDASVVGKVFWASAVGDVGNTQAALHSLERKGFVRRQRRSSLEGENELAFAHALVRDVAYGQIARGDRAVKHRRVAEWIESLGRPADHAEMLAHHWQAALGFARAAGSDGREVVENTRRALREAGDRAFSLNAFAVAETYYAEALELWPEGGADRSQVLFQRARALHWAADERRVAALEEARDALLAGGDGNTAAEAEAFLAQAAWYRGKRDDSQAHMSRALELVSAEPSVGKARVLAFSGRFQMLAEESERAIETANEALAIAEALDLPELRAHALATRGSAKIPHDPTGESDLEEALRLALEISSPISGVITNNLAVLAMHRGDIRRTHELNAEAEELLRRFGDADGLRFTRGNAINGPFFLGDWDTARMLADAFIAECEASPHYMEGGARNLRSQLRLASGDLGGALEDVDRGLAQAREIKDPQRLMAALLASVRAHAIAGRTTEARAFAAEALACAREHVRQAGALAQIGLVAEQLGIRGELLDVLDRAPRQYWVEVAKLYARGDFVRARDAFAESGARGLAAEANLLAGEGLMAEGRSDEALPYLEEALSFYRSVGATYFIGRAEAILAKTA